MSSRTLTTVDGVRIEAHLRSAEDAPRAAVVLVHGFTASGAHPSVTAVAEPLAASGFDVVTYDARGHGRSASRSTLGDLEQHDVEAAVALARERTPHVVVVGASMGAIAALRYATSDPDLAGVVSVSCPAGWRLPRNPMGLLSAGLTRTRVGRAIAARHLRVRIASRWGRPVPPAELAAKVRTPVVYVHGENDRFIPPADAAELYARSDPARARLVLVPGMGHAFEPSALPAIETAVTWLLGHTSA